MSTTPGLTAARDAAPGQPLTGLRRRFDVGQQVPVVVVVVVDPGVVHHDVVHVRYSASGRVEYREEPHVVPARAGAALLLVHGRVVLAVVAVLTVDQEAEPAGRAELAGGGSTGQQGREHRLGVPAVL